MAKQRLCAYHLCGKYFDPPRSNAHYCTPACYRLAKQWRWRHRKPGRRAAQQKRYTIRASKRLTKAIYAQRRAPLLARVQRMEKMLRETTGKPHLTE